MVQVLLIATFVVLFLRDQLELKGPLLRGATPGLACAVELGGLGALALLTHVVVWAQGRRLDRSGSARAVRAADAAVTVSRVLASGVHAFAVLCLGWLDAVRGVFGDLVLLDELAAAAPVLLVLCAGWWSLYPIDRRLREAALIRGLDEGLLIHPMPGRAAYVVGALRHQSALIVVPILLISAWTETVNLGFDTFDPAGAGKVSRVPWWLPISLYFAGTAVVLTLMPLVLRRVWHTSALGPGALRDRLMEMCRRHRVRVREVLVWGTHGTMINGAVMGFVGWVRYILLTDVLLECLPQVQVEAVMAHELGHVRRRHMIWLGIAAISAISLAQAGLSLAARRVWGEAFLRSEMWQAALSLGALVVGLMVFGFVSRRFEWQADAFAAGHLSGAGAKEGRGATVTPEAVEAMSGALGTVARLNRIPPGRFTWRHGSISTRMRKLGALAGRRADDLPIDREVRVVKGLCAAALAVVVWITVDAVREEHRLETGHAHRQDARHR